MYIYTEDDDRWMRAERAARERNQDVSEKVQKARIEVAREIFAEIDKATMISRACEKRGITFDFGEFIAELKKKYTEESK